MSVAEFAFAYPSDFLRAPNLRFGLVYSDKSTVAWKPDSKVARSLIDENPPVARTWLHTFRRPF